MFSIDSSLQTVKGKPLISNICQGNTYVKALSYIIRSVVEGI